jgi:hypothetical protein
MSYDYLCRIRSSKHMGASMNRIIIFLSFVIAILVLSWQGALTQDWTFLSDRSLGVTTKTAWLNGTTVLFADDTVLVSTDGLTWQRGGDGVVANVYAMAVDGDTLYALGDGGQQATHLVFASSDGGNTFERRGGVDIEGGAAIHLSVEPGRIVVGSNRLLLWESTDGGRTYVERTVPSTVQRIVDLSVEGQLWVVTGTGGAAVSKDGGNTWSMMPPGPGVAGSIQKVRVAGGRAVGAGTMGMYVYDGTSWLPTTGLPEGATLPPIGQDIQRKGTSVYAVVQPFGGAMSIHMLEAGSTVWKQVGSQTWPGQHGSARGMICVAADHIVLHYVGIPNGPRGTYRSPVLATSVATTSGQRFAMAPNPAMNEVIVRAAVADGTDVTVTSMDGAVWARVAMEGEQAVFGTGNMPSGRYCVRIGTTTQLLTVVR